MITRCKRVRRARPLLGTLVEISLAGNDANKLHKSANAAFDAIASIHDIMSFHLAGSDISRLNSAAGSVVKVDPRTWHVIKLANEISLSSDGVFDITVGGEMMARGDLPRMQSHLADRTGSSRNGFWRNASSRTASWRDVDILDANRVRFRRPLAIDVGGIAKGYAVDCAVRVLQELGVDNGCVNAGGDLRVFGDESVPVEVRDPVNPQIMGARATLQECAFATSANYAADTGPGPAGVVLDPRDSAPVIGGHSASVRAKTCVIADALAKCVLVMGPESGKILHNHDAVGFMLGPDGPALIDGGEYQKRLRDNNGRCESFVAKPEAVQATSLTSSSNTDLADINVSGAVQ